MPENTSVPESELRALVAFCRTILSAQRVTEALIDATVDGHAFVAPQPESVRTRIKRALRQELFITQKEGVLIQSKCTPWLGARKASIDQYYWGRLQRYLSETGELPQGVVSILDTVTDEILDCCMDPLTPGQWATRGMVMGHVQSGKTTNYGALICKAADAGYRVIILLAGITNSLRSQTQQRMDEYFIGRKSVFNAAAQAPLPITQYGKGVLRNPDFSTSRDQDFNRNNAVGGAAFAALREPKIFVIKKNKSILETLNVWLRDQAHGGKIDEPLLMIDDEADNASINTHSDPSRTTTINKAIRDTLEQFHRSAFIGYTATPFANIFIDPETSDDFETEDLFPKHFIKALDPPSNYCGAGRYFAEDGDLRGSSVIAVSDYADLLPLEHKIDHPLSALPPSLEEAVRTFVLARAVRVMRGDGRRHCTMMVNASRFNNIQLKIEGLIHGYLSKLRSAIEVSGSTRDWPKDPMMQALSDTFSTRFKGLRSDDGEVTFDDVRQYLHEGAVTIVMKTVNMTRSEGLDYERNKENGLHVIAVGGLALSRGLTLEGLVTTYLLRNVGAADTLMQMARWFGYRPGYEDLCRIFLPQSAIDHYEATHEAIEELREEIVRMSKSGGTPMDFGLKVRQSETGIRITSSNKMRTAVEMRLAAGYAGKFVQGHAIVNDSDVNSENIRAVQAFLALQGDPDTSGPTPARWTNAKGRDVLRMLAGLQLAREVQPMLKISGDRSLLGDYISDRVDDELIHWDVYLATRATAAPDVTPVKDFLPGFAIHPVIRDSATVAGRSYRFSGSKNAIGDQNTPKLGLTEHEIAEADALDVPRGQNRYGLMRTRPMLAIFLVNPARTEPRAQFGAYALSVAVCLPQTAKPVKEHTYQVNQVLLNQIRQESADNVEEDEAAILEAQA